MAKPANSSDVERQRKQRKNISLEDKIDINKRKEDNTKLSDEKLANEYGVDRSTISTILRKKEKFLQLHASANYSDLKKNLHPRSAIPFFGRSTLQMVSKFTYSEYSCIPRCIREKAVTFYNEARENGTQLPKFEASKRWLEKF